MFITATLIEWLFLYGWKTVPYIPIVLKSYSLKAGAETDFKRVLQYPPCSLPFSICNFECLHRRHRMHTAAIECILPPQNSCRRIRMHTAAIECMNLMNIMNHHQFNICRSNRPEVFGKKCVLRNFTKFTGKHLCQSLFFNTVAGLAGLRPATLSKKRLWHRCFPRNFAKFLTELFYRTFLGDCFWNFDKL